ncbi:MAG: tRNA lysidine(34) synthetase TilS [Candidatus Lambdaproteobacteria bacterium]|nr:tRNA lysidine(34) synthetase TilS [Candidatus Lambdaproteobacteria bacterium]
MHPLERTLLAHLRRTALIRPGDFGLVAVSGGADSSALAHLLAALAAPLGLHLEVVHFDHGLRPEAAREAEGVGELARGLGLPFHLRRATHLAARTSGVQAAARRWRFEQAEALRAERGAAWVATGHQRDDQLETLLLKLLRGAHLTRLAGMAARSGPFVRPLLGMSHQQLVAYLQARAQGWVEDPSNRSPRYARSRVRHELLPLLESLTGGALAARLASLAAQSAELAALVAALPLPAQSDPVAQAHGLAPAPGITPAHWIAADELARGAPAAQVELLQRFIQARLPGALGYDHLERAAALLRGGRPAWSLDLPGRRRLRRCGGRLLLERQGGAPAAPRVVEAAGRRFAVDARWALSACEREPPPAAAGAALALHGIPAGATLDVRARRPGDRFHPVWRGSPILLGQFLRDQRVPLWERDGLPLLVLGGAIAAVWPRWVAGAHAAPRTGEPPLWVAVRSV